MHHVKILTSLHCRFVKHRVIDLHGLDAFWYLRRCEFTAQLERKDMTRVHIVQLVGMTTQRTANARNNRDILFAINLVANGRRHDADVNLASPEFFAIVICVGLQPAIRGALENKSTCGRQNARADTAIKFHLPGLLLIDRIPGSQSGRRTKTRLDGGNTFGHARQILARVGGTRVIAKCLIRLERVHQMQCRNVDKPGVLTE